MDDPAALNRRHSMLLLGVTFALVAVVIAVVALLVGFGLIGLGVALVVAGAVTAGCWWGAEPVVLRVSGASRTERSEQPRLHNLVEGLCAANGVDKPDLYIADDPAPNAFAAGRHADHAAIVVTSGLLEVMSRVELEAVLAHELTRIKNADILVDTLVVTTPVAARLVGRAPDTAREQRTDLAAVELTRYPPALASALTKVRDDTTVTAASSPLIAHLWMAPARDGGEPTRAVVGRSGDALPIDARIAALQEL